MKTVTEIYCVEKIYMVLSTLAYIYSELPTLSPSVGMLIIVSPGGPTGTRSFEFPAAIYNIKDFV